MRAIFFLLLLTSCASKYRVSREDHFEVRHIKVQSREEGVNLFELASLYAIRDCSSFENQSVQFIYSRQEGKAMKQGYLCNSGTEKEFRSMKELEILYCSRNKSDLMAHHCKELAGQSVASR